jgi:acetyl-CoA carboxylase biotin carboxyl carrier protein
MNIDHLQQLSAWLAATDIALLELRGPGGHIRLRHEGASVELVEDEAPATADEPPAQAPRLSVTACSVGVFLHGHPLHTAPLVRPRGHPRAGQPLGLLQIGSLLLPVVANQDATLVGPLVADGESVGFGTPLFELEPFDEAP